jgi:serine/threonine-protein kinase RsbW
VADHDLSTVPQLADTRPVDAGGCMLAQSGSLTVGWYADEHIKPIWVAFSVHPEPS